LNVHVAQARFWLVRAGMVEIGDLLGGQRRLRVQVAHIEGALDVVPDPGAGIGDDPHRAGNAALARRAEPDPGAAIDDQQPAVGVPPDRALQRIEFVARQKLTGALPDQRWFGDVSIAIERWKILGHRREALNGHLCLLLLPNRLRRVVGWVETLDSSLPPG